MKIQQPTPAVVPRTLEKELLSTGSSAEDVPGLIISTQVLSHQNASFARALGGLAPANGLARPPALLLAPKETSQLFAHSEELGLLKSVAGLIAQQVHPYLKTGVDAVWLVYKAAQLQDEWNRPDRDAVVCGIRMAGLALSSASLVGGVYPDFKLPDAWSNGINFVLKSGECVWQGKTVPVNEMVFSTDKRLDIPIKVLKLAGVSLDPPALPAPVLPIPRPLFSPLGGR